MAPKTMQNPSRTKCVVKGCSTRICSGVSMHGFPNVDKYPDLYQHWVDAIRLANKTPLWNPRKSNRVCAFHFETVENCRIRVPTVFPNIDGEFDPTSTEQNYEDDYDDLSVDDNEVDPIDAYENSFAASTIMAEEPLAMPYNEVENTESTVGYIEDDSDASYEDIEERYNAIVGDVVSTLVTDENVMDEDTNIIYNEEEERTEANNVEEEIVYEDEGDYIGAYFNEEKNSSEQTPVFSAEQIKLNQGDLPDDDYCVVVIRHDPNETKPDHTSEVAPSESEVRKESPSKSIINKSPPKKKSGKKSGNHRRHKASARTLGTIKATKTSSNQESGGEEVSEAFTEESPPEYLSLSAEVKELLLKNEEISHSETDVSEFHREGRSGNVKSPSKKAKTKRGESESSPIKKSPGKHKRIKTTPNKEKENETSPTRKRLFEPEDQEMSTKKDKETEIPDAGRIPLEQEERKPSPGKYDEKESVSKTKHEDLKINGLLLDGEPIKLKECSVNITTPTKSKSKKIAVGNKEIEKAGIEKTTSIPASRERYSENEEIVPGSSVVNHKCSSSTKGTAEDRPEKKEFEMMKENREKSMEQNAEHEEMAPGSSSDFLNALALKSSQDEGNANSGLRRSARIRAGAGKRKKFGTRSSWSVAFKDPPKKKLKIETDEASESSGSAPYDFEIEDDPDVEVSDLDVSDTSISDADSEIESDISSRSRKKSTPKSTNAVAPRKKRKGRAPYVAGNEANNRKVPGRYHRVRMGDQATQVGLPGKCDGFIFDVVREDPRNVGVTCNVFYHYQPKNYRHNATSWTRAAKKIDTPAAAASINGVKLPTASRIAKKIDHQHKEAPEVSVCGAEGTSNKRKSNSVGQVENMSDDALGKNLGSGAACITLHGSTEEAVNVVENNHENNHFDTDETKDFDPGNILCVGEIKIEPAMDVSPSVTNSTSDIDKSTAGGNPHGSDANSMGPADFSEVEIKEEEEELHDSVPPGSCIVTDLCEVSHNDESTDPTKGADEGNDTDAVATRSMLFISEPEVPPRNHSITEYMATDGSSKGDSAEQSCLVKRLEQGAENNPSNDRQGAEVEDGLDTSDNALGQFESDDSSARMETDAHCRSRTLDSVLGRKDSSNENQNFSSTKKVAAPSIPRLDTISADPCSSDRDSFENNSRVQVHGYDVGLQMSTDDNALNEPEAKNDPVAESTGKPRKDPNEGEHSSSKEGGDNVKKSTDTRSPAGPEVAAALPNIEPEKNLKPSKSHLPSSESGRGEVSFRLKGAEGIEPPRDSKELSAEPEGEAESTAADDTSVRATDVGTSDSSIDGKTQDPEDENIPVRLGSERQNDLAVPHSANSQVEAARQDSPGFSDETSSNCKVPIPDVQHSNPKETAMPILPCSRDVRGIGIYPAEKSSLATPSIKYECTPEPNLETSRNQNVKMLPDVEEAFEESGSQNSNHLPSKNSFPVEEGKSVSSQELFDSVERNLEKLFEMNR